MMPRLILVTLGTFALGTLVAAPGRTENITFPASVGVLNVRDFGAKGDGVSDDTGAIQKALIDGLAKHRVVYLPDGVYAVTDTLKWQDPAQAGNKVQGWAPFLQLQGQSRAGTVIRLKDNAPGFGNEESPKAVIATGSSGSHGGKTYRGGEGNEAFENHLRNFTVETGNNAGAVGIDYQVSNTGAMRHVSIKGNGFAGISLMRRDNGPGLIKDVSIDGFQFGIRTAQEIAHFTLEDITLSNQGEAGIWVRDSIVAARKITSKNRVPAMQVGGVALVALFDSDFSGGEGAAAIATQGTEPRFYIRNLKTAGYGGSVRLRGQVQKPELSDWSSDKPVGNAAEKLSLGLPVRETPEWYDADHANWAVLPPPSGQDDTQIIQTALNSGQATVFFPYGRYFISDTLSIPASVKRIQGLGTQLNTKGRLPDNKPMLRFEGARAGDLTIFDRFECGAADGFMVEHVDARTVVMTDLIVFGASGYRNKVGAGPLFVEDVACGGWRFAPGTQAWTRQWNIEGHGPAVTNDGATIWTLGWKTEGGGLILENKNGGRAEMWGGFAYTFGVPADRPSFTNTDASLAAQFAGTTFMGPGGYYDLLVKDTQGGKTSELRRSSAVARGGAATVPLYVSFSGAAPGASNDVASNDKENDVNLKQLAAAVAAASAITPPALAQAAPDAKPAEVKTYRAPEFFDGEEKGKATGNPLEAGGRGLWRLDQIWPDDPLKRENYKPMNWAGDTWRGAYEFGGQPAGKVEAGKITLAVRGGWGGGGTMPGNKMAAWVFVAPAAGTYTLTGTARAGVWQGDKSAASLAILKSDPGSGKVWRVRSIPMPGEQDVKIEDVTVDLDAVHELALVPMITQMYTAANVELRDVKVQSGAAPSTAGAAATNSSGTAGSSSGSAGGGALKAGEIVTVNRRRYRVEICEGRIVVLRAEE